MPTLDTFKRKNRTVFRIRYWYGGIQHSTPILNIPEHRALELKTQIETDIGLDAVGLKTYRHPFERKTSSSMTTGQYRSLFFNHKKRPEEKAVPWRPGS